MCDFLLFKLKNSSQFPMTHSNVKRIISLSFMPSLIEKLAEKKSILKDEKYLPLTDSTVMLMFCSCKNQNSLLLVWVSTLRPYFWYICYHLSDSKIFSCLQVDRFPSKGHSKIMALLPPKWPQDAIVMLMLCKFSRLTFHHKGYEFSKTFQSSSYRLLPSLPPGRLTGFQYFYCRR